MKKKFKKAASEIKRLIPEMGYCFASDMITVKGNKVGYMYRESPDRDGDSGWRFFSGHESDEYVNNPDNLEMYEVNTIANYDPDIIPFLNAPINSAFARESSKGDFIKEDFYPPEE